MSVPLAYIHTSASVFNGRNTVMNTVKGKGKGTILPITGHEGPEGE
jgi:hypothetical protein